MPLDLANSWKVLSDPQTVQLRVKTVDGVHAAPITVNNVLRRAAKKETEVAGNAREGFSIDLYQKTVVFHLWASQVGTTVPKIEDTITDDEGKTWSITEVDIQSHSQRFRCTCQEVK